MDISKKVSFRTNYCIFDEIDEKDNNLIFRLRSLDKKNLLYKKNYSLSDQYRYYKNLYLQSRKKIEEIYFKIKPLDKQKKNYGFVRLTNLKKKLSFSWDSLIVSENSQPWFAIDITVAIYNVGFNILNKKYCGLWTVPKLGTRVKNFHLKMDIARVVREDEKFYYFKATREQFNKKYIYFKKINIGIIKNL